MKTFRSSILAGICISIGGTAYLTSPDILGAILFTFGLLTVVHYKFALYTGTVGFVKTKQDAFRTLLTLLGNIIGCIMIGLAIRYSKPDLIPVAQHITEVRTSGSIISLLILSMGCGFVMTTIVKFAREGKFIPLLFGIPLFITCGFIHSIADAFYYSTAMIPSVQLLMSYVTIVIGNLVGCNLTRLIIWDKDI